MEGMSTTATTSDALPTPEVILARIASAQDELRALRRLLRASRAAQQADEARRRRTAGTPQGGERHAS
jgi:hypothetical protein